MSWLAKNNIEQECLGTFLLRYYWIVCKWNIVFDLTIWTHLLIYDARSSPSNMLIRIFVPFSMSWAG